MRLNILTHQLHNYTQCNLLQLCSDQNGLDYQPLAILLYAGRILSYNIFTYDVLLVIQI